MKLHILSDLHLSLGPLELQDNDANAVVVAGDIARPKEAVAWLRALRKPVMYVPGNHASKDRLVTNRRPGSGLFSMSNCLHASAGDEDFGEFDSLHNRGTTFPAEPYSASRAIHD
jgi:predicted phosphodiesterase